MSKEWIDYRSDTVTLPSQGMREAMASAPLGDDVFGEDPSVNKLETSLSERFGMEAGLFCPSGTMTNQIAINCHTRPGEEVVCEQTAHIYQYEGGGIAFNSGCSSRLLPGDRGRFTAAQAEAAINPDDVHRPRTALIAVENTSNRGGGSCYRIEELEGIRTVCDRHRLPFHLDGARLFNAIAAGHGTPQDYGRLFTTISICLSKGLGAPVGSVLLGSRELIHRGRRVRKLFGGGMRQAGILAAAGLYALDHQVERLKDDHEHARLIADALQKRPFVEDVLPVETNIIIFSVRGMTAQDLTQRLLEKGVRVYAITPAQIRIVIHLDITPEMVGKTIKALNEIS